MKISVVPLTLLLLLVSACANACRDRTAREDTTVQDQRATASVEARHGPAIVGISLKEVRKDNIALRHVVKSKIYPEDPDTMFLTLRGGGISVYDVSDPRNPKLTCRWNSAEDVEGQDRLGDLLVVVARAGKILTFDISGLPVMRRLGELELTTHSGLLQSLRGGILTEFGTGPFDALHVKIYQPDTGKIYAMVSATNTRELIAVDITDPSRPVQVGAVDTHVEFIEGIYIKDHHAFVGGFGNSGVYTAVNISNPGKMKIAKSLSDVAFRQMVSEMKPSHPNVLYAALWNDPGGLGTFDVSVAGDFKVIDTLLRPEFMHANRVKLLDDYAFIPLEQEPGGFGVIDVTRADDLEFVSLIRGIRDVTSPYTLELKGDFLYVFGEHENSMAIFEVEKGRPETSYFAWNFSADTDTNSFLKGRPADEGQGELVFLDGAMTGKGSTYSKVSSTTRDGIGCLLIEPGRDTWKRTNGLFLKHGIDRHFYGTTPQYTIVWDLYFPENSFDSSGCASNNLARCNEITLYQLDRRNEQDGELLVKLGKSGHLNGFIGKSGDPITVGGLDGYEQVFKPDQWYRIAMVVDLAQARGQARIYVNGTRVKTVDRIDYERFAAIAEGDPDATDLIVSNHNGFLLFADNDGENEAAFYLSSFLFADRAYSDSEMMALGVPTVGGIPVGTR